MASNNKKTTSLSDKLSKIEEVMIAALLGAMTLITFANVIARYFFNSNIFYALELSVFLFAWLVLLGASYAVKHNLHLGIDFFVNSLNVTAKRYCTLFAVFVSIVYALLLLKGAWDYWAPYANLPPTEGRWFPIGFPENYRKFGWFETKDIPVPFFLNWISDVFNNGEEYQKLPKFIPYFVLPIAMLMLLVRFINVAKKVWLKQQSLIIVSHEFEQDVSKENKNDVPES